MPRPALPAPTSPCRVDARQTTLLTLPKVYIDHDYAAAIHEFEAWLRPSAQRIASRGPVTVLAPYGGSKISPIRELDAVGLVIVSWERPGTPEEICRSFGTGKGLLVRVLTRALNRGGMDTNDVDSVAVGAQLLGRLHAELGVSDVRLGYYLPSSPSTSGLLPLWSGDPVGENDPVLVLRIQFAYRDKQREIAFVSYKVSPDQVDRPAIPVALLGRLSPTGYSWGYVSADGMGLFSGNPGNGLSRATREFVAAIRAGGAVLIDYPSRKVYNTPQLSPDGAVYMAGRAPLEGWGFEKRSWYHPKENVFGYMGLGPEDEIRVYDKLGGAPAPGATTPLDFSSLVPVATGIRVRMVTE